MNSVWCSLAQFLDPVILKLQITFRVAHWSDQQKRLVKPQLFLTDRFIGNFTGLMLLHSSSSKAVPKIWNPLICLLIPGLISRLIVLINPGENEILAGELRWFVLYRITLIRKVIETLRKPPIAHKWKMANRMDIGRRGNLKCMHTRQWPTNVNSNKLMYCKIKAI